MHNFHVVITSIMDEAVLVFGYCEFNSAMCAFRQVDETRWNCKIVRFVDGIALVTK